VTNYNITVPNLYISGRNSC